MNKSSKLLIILLLLGSGAISFLHSELEFLDCDNDSHSKHDYCEIIKYTPANTKTLQDSQPKIEISKIIFAHCADSIESLTFEGGRERSNKHLIAKQSTHICLFNSTFLI